MISIDKTLVFLQYFLLYKLFINVINLITNLLNKNNMNLNLQYITDRKGKKNAVLLPISDWDKIQKDLEELEHLKNKKLFFQGLKDSFIEVAQIKKGKKKPNSFDDLINDL
jgi:hypothetical protein